MIIFTNVSFRDRYDKGTCKNTQEFLYSKIPILRPPFGQSQRWSLIRDTLGVENEEKNYLNFANKVFNG